MHPCGVEKALVCNSLTVPGYLCHDNKVGFHFKGTAQSLKYFLFLLEGGFIFSKFCVAAVWRRATAGGGRHVCGVFAVVQTETRSGKNEKHADTRYNCAAEPKEMG